MAGPNKSGMLSGMSPLPVLTGNELMEVSSRQPDGSWKTFSILASKIRTNQGLSAYEVAVVNGFVGTEEEWLATLDGKSIYQIAVDNGYTGTEQEWLAEANAATLAAQGYATSAEESATAAIEAKDSAEELRPLIIDLTESATETLNSSNAALDETRLARDAVVGAEAELDLMKQLLAAIPADPTNAVVSWEIAAKDFNLVQGGATFKAIAARVSGWSMPDEVASYLTTIASLPSHWATMDIYVKWVNEVANTGNCVIGGEIHKWKVGETINATPAGGSGVMPANPSPYIVSESKVAADLPLDPTRLTTIRIARQGASANDTLLNAMTILSVRLVKKS